MASGFRRAMDASNRLDFGLDSRVNVNGFDYAGDGFDRGLPIFLSSFLEEVIHRLWKVTLVLFVRQQMCFLGH